jgi:multidrug efflux pump subunit AcrB
MPPHARSDEDIVRTTHNTARFFVENRQVAWVLLAMSVLWGVYGYIRMPKRKDPEIPARIAVAVCPWPGASAERIEQLVTRQIEERAAENARVSTIESISRSNVSIVYIMLAEGLANPGTDLDDVRLKLDSLRDLPPGAGPIEFEKDFGDTAALTLTIASPKVGDLDVGLRARAIAEAIRSARKTAKPDGQRAALVVSFPGSISPAIPKRQRDLVADVIEQQGAGRDLRRIDGVGFVGVDLETSADDRTLLGSVEEALSERLHASEFHPDTWPPVVIRDPADTAAKLQAVAGDKYSYRELDDVSDLIKRTLQNVPQVSRISVSGLLKEQIQLEYSQELVAGMQNQLSSILGARNITLPGGVLEVEGKNLTIDPSGEFRSEREIGNVIVGASASGRPLYLRDSVEISRGYESPARYLNFLRWQDAQGGWHRSRAITLAIQMRPAEQIAVFGRAVDQALAGLKGRLPDDLILSRISDQPVQVEESVDLFTESLYEAVVLVVLVALVGFWEWRSAALIALSIPVTLALTFGAMHLLGLDIQQVSLASLIIALGLLVDDPVVAGDAIKRALDERHPPETAAWLGPTKLATAIMFATVTNIVAYLPLLLVSGDTGRFLYSLPIVVTAALVMSRIVSMSFIPMLGYYLLRPSRREQPTPEARRTQGFTGSYHRLAGWALDHRWLVFGSSVVLLAVGLTTATSLHTQFFPIDLQYLSYVDVWLPEDATFEASNQAAESAEQVIQDVAARYGREHPGPDGKARPVLESLSTFVGGGGPRFWISVFPEIFQANYAQIIIKFADKHDTAALAPALQQALSGSVVGARVDVRQLETGKPVGIPVAFRISGSEIATLRTLAESLKQELGTIPHVARVRDDWGAESFVVTLQVDPDRANLAGVSNQDVALSSAIGMNGFPVTTLREGDKQIPVVARLRPEERARLSDIRNLYVYSATGPQKVPLGQVSTIEYGMKTEKLRRRNQFRTVTVSAFPEPGILPSQIMNATRRQLASFEQQLPPGYRVEIGGEEEEATKGFSELSVVIAISILAIFLALVCQFRHAVKPFIVFSAIPYGVAGSLATLAALGTPFGFMAFLGVASLIGVIVSHVIVLFDFIEEAHANGEPLREALLDAGILRLRPVLITVGATVFGLVPLAVHGGPLWQPLCFAQIGGLVVATFVTLLLVPVLYAMFVLDLKIVTWTAAPVDAGPAVPKH